MPQTIRQKALDKFEQQGWPTRKQEAWKYTPTQLLQKHALDLDPNLAVRFDNPAISGLQIELLTEKHFNHTQTFFTLSDNDSALTLLNHALCQATWVIRATKQHDGKPLRIQFAALQALKTQYTQFIFIVEAHASLQVIMEHTESAGFANILIHTELATGAEITFLDHCAAGDDSLHFIQHTVNQQARSILNHYALALQAKWLRHELMIHCNESEARCHLNGLYFAVANQFVDHHLCVNHHVPHCQSNQFYKGVLADQAHGVFNSKVIVFKEAQKTISSQKNHNILLSSSAEIDTKPELEIYNDDVLCSHGATVGALSEDAVFYLISRGIAPIQAKKILLEAFMQEIFSQDIPGVEQAKHAVAQRLTTVCLEPIHV